MEFVGSIFISSELALCEVAGLVSDALNLRLQPDDSGKYEEFAAYVANVLGFELALLEVGEVAPVPTGPARRKFQLLVQTFDDAADDGPEVDLSRHLQILVTAVGLSATTET